MNVLIIDDEKSLCDALAGFVEKIGPYTVSTLCDSRQAVDMIRQKSIDLLITDVRMPRISGIQLAETVRRANLPVEVVLISGQSDIIESINSLELGVFDFLKKPVDLKKLAEIIREIEKKKRRNEAGPLSLQDIFESRKVELKDLEPPAEWLFTHEKIGTIIIASEIMRNIFKKLLRIQEYPDIPVLIEGRTGTGKEVIARLIHYRTMGEERPFIGINCAAIGKDLFESELFGYARGAFTGAEPGGREGKLALAEGGSLFLDEISEISPDLQSKLLRVLQEKEYYPVGGNQKRTVKSRIICATNRNLQRMIGEGTFREDLYYRLDACKVTIPPLNRRREEIIPLAYIFILEMNARKSRKIREAEGEALALLHRYDWRGGVRHLKNAVIRALLFNDSSTLRVQDLDFLVLKKKDRVQPGIFDPGNFELPERPFPLNDFIEEIIRKTLVRFAGNKSRTAEFLGLNRLQLYNRYKGIIEDPARGPKRVLGK